MTWKEILSVIPVFFCMFAIIFFMVMSEIQTRRFDRGLKEEKAAMAKKKEALA